MNNRFKYAVVRKPCASMVNGLSAANLGIPDFELALVQHEHYIQALKSCGLEVFVLEADDDFPDSCFVEDVALCTPECAVITLPGAPSRKGEIELMESELVPFFKNIERINEPGTLEAGDVMMVGGRYFIGLSERTNLEGAQQLISILKDYGLAGTVVQFSNMLHLKTGVSYLEQNNLLVCGEFVQHEAFKNFKKLIIPEEESYAANSIWVNGKVIVPKGYPVSKKLISQLGYPVLEVDVSEFRKLDGGLSCLSLRF